MNFLGPIDWLFVIAYLVVIAVVSIWSIRKSKETTSDYFLANRNLGWFVIGASILASNVGSEHIVGLAGSAAQSGTVLGHYELHSYIVLILGWVFVPFYIRSSVYTMPEFLEKRFNPQSRRLLTIIQLISYVIAKASVTIFAGALVFNQFIGVDFWTGAINMFLPLDDPEFPWLGILFASPIVGVWYWCTDQHIVQRCLAAKNEKEARRGTIFAAFLKLMPFFIFLIPGLIAYALHEQGKIQLDDANAAFPVMVKSIMPVGLRGVLAGGLLAALMSSLASVYNACSTLYTIDIYKKSHPNASEKELVKVGRIATGIIVLMGMAWIPLMGRVSGGLYNYLQSVQSYMAPPISAVFLLGVFFKRLNAQGAYSSMVIGFIVGMSKLALQLMQDQLTPGSFLYQFATMNFLYFCIYLFIFSIIIFVVVSLMTPAPTEEKVKGLTFSTTVAEDKASSRASWNRTDVVLSMIVIAVIIGIMMYFSPLGVAA